MSVCPFCKAPVPKSTDPCPRCGKLASDHPSIAAVAGRTLSTDFDDDLGELHLEKGSAAAGAGSGGGASPFDDSRGLTLDDDVFSDAGPGTALELDLPTKPAPAASAGLAARPAARVASNPPTSQPRGSEGMLERGAPDAGGGGPSSVGGSRGAAHAVGSDPAAPTSAPGSVASGSGSTVVSTDARRSPSPHDQAAARIASYPTPPTTLWHAPSYAIRVLWRQIELRQDIAALRRKRSKDVALYERALATHDARMYKVGLAIAGVALTVATILFFMPVIARFAFAPE